MRNDRALLVLVLADFALVILTIVTELSFQSTLPAALRDYGGFGHPTLGDIVRIPVWIAIAMGTFVAWIGLLNYWWPSRMIYAVAWAAWLLLVAMSGPSVMTAAGAAVETLEHLVGGAIIALVYFSDLSKRFEEDDVTAPLSSRA